jgi:hypothetical protein
MLQQYVCTVRSIHSADVMHAISSCRLSSTSPSPEEQNVLLVWRRDGDWTKLVSAVCRSARNCLHETYYTQPISCKWCPLCMARLRFTPCKNPPKSYLRIFIWNRCCIRVNFRGRVYIRILQYIMCYIILLFALEFLSVKVTQWSWIRPIGFEPCIPLISVLFTKWYTCKNECCYLVVNTAISYSRGPVLKSGGWDCSWFYQYLPGNIGTVHLISPRPLLSTPRNRFIIHRYLT